MESIILSDIKTIPPCPEEIADIGNGVNSFIYRGKHLDKIQKSYGRDNCCLKIFKNREKFKDDPREKWWGNSHPAKGSTLAEATHIQNLFAYYNLAPRVYALLIVKINGKKHWAQLTEDLGTVWGTPEEQQTLIKGMMAAIAEKHNITIFDDGRESNIMQGKYIDFQAFHLNSDYVEQLKKRIVGIASVGRWGPWQNYQDIDELEIKGGRKMNHRIKELHLKDIPKDNTILDVGCSEGAFCRYLIDKGAKRVLGIDLPGVVGPAMEWSYYMGYYNIDFVGIDLLKKVPHLGKFDITLFLSMGQHIGLPDWVIKATDLLIFEGNGKDDDAGLITKIKHRFQFVEERGFTLDLFKRPVIWAYK